MNILLLCYEKINGNNGAVRQILENAEKLQKIGHRVAICVPRIARLPNPPVPIYYIPVINIPNIRYPSYIIFSIIFLIPIFFKFKPHRVLYYIIHYNIAAFLTLQLFRCPYAVYVNGIIHEERAYKSLLEKWSSPILQRIYKITLHSANIIFTVTGGLKKHLISSHLVDHKNILILKDGVDTDVFTPRDKKQLRKKLCLNEKGSIIGFHGWLFPWHGVDYLIEAAPYIINELPDTVFLIVGYGIMYHALQDMVQKKNVQKHVVFTGSVPFNKIAEYVSCFDLGINFFKPVRTDPGDPIKMYEYMACEVPIIASDVEGYGDFLEKAGAGVRINPEDPQNLAQKIIELLKNPDARKKMGAAGRKEVQNNHTWMQRALQIEQSFKNM
ncbi:MAG: glycosyltransferase family 4 protein [bacterium]